MNMFHVDNKYMHWLNQGIVCFLTWLFTNMIHNVLWTFLKTAFKGNELWMLFYS